MRRGEDENSARKVWAVTPRVDAYLSAEPVEERALACLPHELAAYTIGRAVVALAVRPKYTVQLGEGEGGQCKRVSCSPLVLDAMISL